MTEDWPRLVARVHRFALAGIADVRQSLLECDHAAR